MFIEQILNKSFSIKGLFYSCRAERNDGFYFYGEAHDLWELLFIEGGTAGVTEDDKVYELTQGELILHKPMEFHKLWNAGKGEYMKTVVISFSTLGDLPINLTEGKMQVASNTQKKIIELAEMGSEICDSEKSRELYGHEFALKLEMLLLELSKTTKMVDDTVKTIDALRYKKIIKVMREHVEENLSLDEIAHYAGLSPSNLKVVFAKFADGGVKNYFNAMRVRYSVDLLREGLGVGEISDRMSYSSQNYYSLAFKKEMGFSPMIYRMKYLYDKK